MTPIGLLRRRSSVRGMQDVASFLLVRRGFAVSTVTEMERKWRLMERYGWQMSEFLRGPKVAEAHVELVFERAKRAGHPANTLRDFAKVVNRSLLYAKHVDKRFQRIEPWPLMRAPRPRKERHTPGELEAMRGYTHPNEVLSIRRRAMLCVAEHTGLRRGEIARLQRGQLEFRDGRWWIPVLDPEKNGDRRYSPMPTDDVDRRLVEYLDWRDAIHGPKGALWVTVRGSRPMSAEKAGQELYQIGKALGFRVGFTKARRTHARRLLKARVHEKVGARALGQASAEVFEGYAGDLDDQDVLDEFHRVGLEGY